MTVRPYPWSALERVPKQAIRRQRELSELGASLWPEQLGSALEAILGAPVEVSLRGLSVGPPRERMSELDFRVGGLSITLGLEPALATTLLEQVFARPFALPRAEAALDPSVAGALAALCVEVARRVTHEPVTLAEPPERTPEPLCAQATILVAERPYAAYALVWRKLAPTAGAPPPNVAALGDLPLAVPLVVAASLATRGELVRLEPGAAFMPGEKAWVNAQGVGRGLLVAATGERGSWVDLTPDGRVVLRGETAELSPDSADSGTDMTDADDVNQTLTDAALEAPVVVRVELGAVSMSASEWARLKSGDVIETGRRVAEPVLLRIAGRVVARGELVEVDGEVGVRVRELFGDKSER